MHVCWEERIKESRGFSFANCVVVDCAPRVSGYSLAYRPSLWGGRWGVPLETMEERSRIPVDVGIGTEEKNRACGITIQTEKHW